MSNILLFNHLFIENVYQINFKEKNIFFQFLPKNKFEQFDWLIQKVEKIDSSQCGRNFSNQHRVSLTRCSLCFG